MRIAEGEAMKRKPLVLLLLIVVVLLGLALLVGTVSPRSLVQTAKGYLQRTRHYVQGYLQTGERLPSSPEDLNLAMPTSRTDSIWAMLAEVDRDRAEDDLRRLTGEEPLCVASGCYTLTHRFTGSDELGWAMDYLYEHLEPLGYTVEFQNWSRSGYTDRNLIARKTGVLTPTEEIYLVAHVDGVKLSPQPYPAADDNASSVVNGLELARVFSERDFGRTIVLLFSTGEEVGKLGVHEYLDALSPAELAAIKYVINRDMTGYDGNGDGLVNLAHGDHPPTLALAQVMSATIDIYELNLDQRIVAGCP
jgi:hypothetical protein